MLFQFLGRDTHTHIYKVVIPSIIMTEENSLKTLKDIGLETCILKRELREEAIKWVKEEKDLFGIMPETKRWMKRFNITEEDLQ